MNGESDLKAEDAFARALMFEARGAWPVGFAIPHIVDRLVFHDTEIFSAAALREMDLIPAEVRARFGEGGSLSILYLRRVLSGLAKVLRQDLGRP